MMQINYTKIYKIITQCYKSMQHLSQSFVHLCFVVAVVAVAALWLFFLAREDESEMFLSFPGFHQPKLLKKARGRDQTLN
jgi:hypothetical protein